MPYAIEYAPRATRAFTKIPRDTQRRILTHIESLAATPRPHGAVKLTGEDAYRIRVGDYRILYAIEDRRLLILIIDIGHRREIYRRN